MAKLGMNQSLTDTSTTLRLSPTLFRHFIRDMPGSVQQC
jgi:hypothetical protein